MKLKLPPSSIRAAITNNSYNETDNSIEVVFATEFEVRRSTWDGTLFDEILECSTAAVRLDRLNAGANLVDSHNTYSVNTIIGVVQRAWIESNQCKATIILSKREDMQGTVQDIIGGIIKNISVGYNIFGATQIDTADSEVIKIRITDWEPMELSVLSVPADYTSGVRGKDNSNVYELNISNKKNTMTPEQIAAAAAEAGRGAPAAVATPAAPAAQPDLGLQERTRVIDINKAVRAAKIDDQEFADGLIERGITIDAARAEILDKLAEAQPNVRGQQGGRFASQTPLDEVEKVRNAMSNAIEHRANPRIALANGGADFRGYTLIDMARECIERAGGNAKGLSRREIAEISMNAKRGVGMNSTSDFPIILGDTVNRVLRAEYDLQMRTFTDWANRGNAKDFRNMTRVSLGEVGDFQEVKEGGEYQYTTLGEAGETYKVVKYGQLIAITWETMINDDLDAFSRIPRKIAAAAARKQSDIVYGILTGNPNMADGNALFSTQHKNLAAAAAAIGVDAMGKLRAQLRTQKGIDGKDFLNLTPQFLITGPANEQLALQYTSTQFTANVSGSINVWAGTVKPIIEPRITDTSWFFAASPGAIDTVEYSFLEGEGELFTEQRQGFEVDGMEIKARMVFGAKAIDWRGLAKNAGV